MDNDFLTPEDNISMDDAIVQSTTLTAEDDPRLDPILPSKLTQAQKMPNERIMTMDEAIQSYRLTQEAIQGYSKIARGDITTHFWGNVAKGAGDFLSETAAMPDKINAAVIRAFNGHAWPNMSENEAIRLMDASTSYVANQQNLQGIIITAEGGADSIGRNLGMGAAQVIAYGVLGALTGGAAVGVLAGVQEAADLSQELAEVAMERGDGTLAGYNGAEDAVYAALHGVISGWIEQRLGVENLFTSSIKKRGITTFARSVLGSTIGEGAEEYLQEASKFFFANLAGKNERTFGEFQHDALTNAAYGAILGGTFGSLMYYPNVKRLQKSIRMQGYSEDEATAIANDMIDTTRESIVREVDDRAQIREHYGEQWEALKNKIVSALDNAGWKETNPDIDLEKYAEDNADNIVRPLFRFSNKFGIDTRDLIQLADIDVIDNAIYLRPDNLGTPDVIASRIKEKQDEVKRLTMLARTGAGNPDRKNSLKIQIELLQKYYEKQTGDRFLAARRSRAAKARADAEILATTAPAVSETITNIDTAKMTSGQPTTQIRERMDGNPFVYVGNQQLPVEYKVVPISEVIASHIGQEVNTNYTLKELQNRAQRGSRTDVSILQARAAKIQPENLAISYNTQNGAPIVNDRGEVIAGNGRYEVLRMTDERGRARYNKYLESLGLDLTGIEKPVLVRVMHGLTPAEQIAVADASNVSATSAFDNASQAVQDAKLLANTNGITDFLNKIPIESRQGLFLANDRVNKVALERRYNDALMMWLLNNDTQLYEDLYLMGGMTQKIQSALYQAIPGLMSLESQYPAVGLRADLAEALKKLPAVARSNDFAFTISQSTIEDGSTDLFNQNALLYALTFGKNTNTWEGTGADRLKVGLTLSEFFDTYTRAATTNQENIGKTDLFGQPMAIERTRGDILAETITIAFPREFEDGTAKSRDMRAVFLTRAQTEPGPTQFSQVDLRDTIQPTLFPADTSTASAVKNLPWERPVDVIQPIFFNRKPDKTDILAAKTQGYDSFLVLDKTDTPTQLVLLDGTTVNLRKGAKIPTGAELYKTQPTQLFQDGLDLAEEMQRLDDVYPAYTGDTITIGVAIINSDQQKEINRLSELQENTNLGQNEQAGAIEEFAKKLYRQGEEQRIDDEYLDNVDTYGNDLDSINEEIEDNPGNNYYDDRTEPFASEQEVKDWYKSKIDEDDLIRNLDSGDWDYVRRQFQDRNERTDFFNDYTNLVKSILESNGYLTEIDKSRVSDSRYIKVYETQNALDSGDYAESIRISDHDTHKYYGAHLNLYTDRPIKDEIQKVIKRFSKERTVYNSNGERIAKSEAALRNFWAWFGDSKVVDDKGRPLVVYHGTSSEFDTFDIDQSGKNTGTAIYGKGFYFTTNKDVATKWGQKRGEPIVMSAYVKLENPNMVEELSYPKDSQEKGFDGVIAKVWGEKDLEIVAFDSNQIKSTKNRGTFSRDTGNIYSQGRRVNGFYDPELEVIVLGRNSNTGTLPHEMAHFWANTIFNLVKSGKYNNNPDFMAQAMGMFKMLGVGINQQTLTRDQQEQFASMTEAVIFGMAPVPQGTELPITAFLNWVPAKYKSILDIGYRNAEGRVVNPILDKNAVEWFNAWYSNGALPTIDASPLAAENSNGQTGDRILPSSVEVMKVRATEMEAESNRLRTARDEQTQEAEAATPASERASIAGATAQIDSEPDNIERSAPPAAKKKSIVQHLIPGRGTNTREDMFAAAREYIAKDRAHAEEVAFGNPAEVMNDTGVDRAILIRSLMEEYSRGDAEYAALYHNLAETVSLAGKTPGLSNDMNFQYYLKALKDITEGMEGRAAIKYAGTRNLNKARRTFNSDIDAFIQERANEILRAGPDTQLREAMINKMFAEAAVKFSGEDTAAQLNQEELRRVRGFKSTDRAVFTEWAQREVRKMLKAAPDTDTINKVMELSEAAEKARKLLDSDVVAEASAAAKKVRDWQMFVKDKQVPETWTSKIIGSWYPKAMLYNINTHIVNITGGTVNYGIVKAAVAAQYKHGNKVAPTTLTAERKRLHELYDSSLINLAAMSNPTSPTLLKGEQYNPREGKSTIGKIADFSMDMLGKEDAIIRIHAYLDALGHIATADAAKTGQDPTALFNEYKKINQPKDSRAYEARQEALHISDLAVFQQTGILSECLKRIRDNLNFGQRAGLGTLLGPFIKTPANIVEQGARAIAAPITAGYHAAKGQWTIQDTIDSSYFVLACILTVGLMADYEPPYQAPMQYDPNKPYDSLRIRGTDMWIKLDTFAAASVPLRIIASIATGKGLGLAGAANEMPLIGDLADAYGEAARIEKDPYKQGVRFGANWAYNRVNTAVPAIIKYTLAAAHPADLNLDEIDIGLPRTGIGRKIGRQYGLAGGDTTTNDILRIFFNRLKIYAE